MLRAQQNERSALCLLALLNLTKGKSWADAENPLVGITPMMEFARDNYGKQYAPNTRETFRRQTMHQLVAAGIALYNPDDPARAVNSPKAVYQIEPDTATRPTRRCWNVRSSAVCRAGKVKQPKGLRRQGGAFLTCYTLPHSCAEWGFPGAGIPYDNVPYRRGKAVSKATVLPQATPTRERVLDPAPGPPPCAASPDSHQTARPR